MIEKTSKEISTQATFAKKWNLWGDFLLDERVAHSSGILDWILARNGWDDTASLSSFLEDKETILDAGCGNGRVTALLSTYSPDGAALHAWDVNEDAAVVNLAGFQNIKVEHADLSQDLLPRGMFDFIYCQEVLHHLPNPEESLGRLAARLKPGGVIAVYVYGIKHPFREFSDEWIREVFDSVPHETQIEISASITRLGQQLSAIAEPIVIEGLEKLGFKSGKYPVQKFFYDYFFKCFWNTQLGSSASTSVNFDWFSPALASKHSVAEVESWFSELGLEILRSHEDEYGITFHGMRKSVTGPTSP
jgi:SAM-dependent methyltransferase